MIFKKKFDETESLTHFLNFQHSCTKLSKIRYIWNSRGISGDELYGNVQAIYYMKENGAKSGWELAMIRLPKTHSKSPPPEWPLVLKQSKYKNLLISNNL